MHVVFVFLAIHAGLGGLHSSYSRSLRALRLPVEWWQGVGTLLAHVNVVAHMSTRDHALSWRWLIVWVSACLLSLRVEVVWFLWILRLQWLSWIRMAYISVCNWSWWLDHRTVWGCIRSALALVLLLESPASGVFAWIYLGYETWVLTRELRDNVGVLTRKPRHKTSWAHVWFLGWIWPWVRYWPFSGMLVWIHFGIALWSISDDALAIAGNGRISALNLWIRLLAWLSVLLLVLIFLAQDILIFHFALDLIEGSKIAVHFLLFVDIPFWSQICQAFGCLLFANIDRILVFEFIFQRIWAILEAQIGFKLCILILFRFIFLIIDLFGIAATFQAVDADLVVFNISCLYLSDHVLFHLKLQKELFIHDDILTLIILDSITACQILLLQIQLAQCAQFAEALLQGAFLAVALLKLALQLALVALELYLEVLQVFAVVLSHWLNIEDAILGRVVELFLWATLEVRCYFL